MPLRLLLPTLLLTAAAHAADIRVSVGDVEDRRSTSDHFIGLEVKLKLAGDDLAKAKAVKVTITKAVDDTGRDLLKGDDGFSRDGYEALNSDNPSRTEIELKLKNPARKAATVAEITGTLRLHMPGGDPESIVTLENHPALSAKPIENAALKKAGVNLRLFTKADAAKLKDERQKQRDADRKAKSSGGLSGWLKDAVGGAFEDAIESGFGGLGGDGDISFLVKDPQQRIVKIEFAGKSGKEIRHQSWSSSGESQSFTFGGGLPADAKILIYLATDKSLLEVPFSFKGVELP